MAEGDRVELTVADRAIHCSACEHRIEGTLARLPGVEKVKANHKTQKVLLTVDEGQTPLAKVLEELDRLGYSVTQQARIEVDDLEEPRPRAEGRQTARPPRHWDAACNAGACGVSVVCMSSMAAATAAAVAAGGAGATGMMGMAGAGATGIEATSAGGAMAAMGGTEATSGAGATAFLPGLFEGVGLGFLNRVPNEVAQPLLVALLVVAVGAAYLSYRGHRRPGSLLLTLASGLTMYASIYVWMSEPLYFLSLAVLLSAGLWGVFLLRAAQRAEAGLG